MELSSPNTCSAVVFSPPGRRRHRHHYHSDSDTDSAYSASSSSSDSDDSTYYRIPHPHRARRRWRWPRGVITYPGYSPWAPGGLQTQVQQQQHPRRYGYRRFHYQGGERVRRGCGNGHGHGHHHHQRHRRARSPRRCILPRFGRWLIGDPPERQRWRRCDDGADCCDDGCGVGTTPTVHHEDEYWGPGRTGNVPSWAYGPDGSRNSPWRYGGPNGNTTSGPDALDPGGTIEEVEEGGTAPVQAAQTLPTAAVLPVAATDPYDVQQPHTHYHLNDDNGRSRRHGHSRSHGRHRRRRDDDNDGDGILRLVDRERRRDSERQMADADASHRREAMMMGLVERDRDRDRDRDRGGGGSAGLDARDVLAVLLDGEVERRRRERGREDIAGESGGGDGWKGALDALSRRVDEMVLQGRDGYSTGEERGRGSREETRRKRAPRVKFTKERNGSGSAGNSNGAGGVSRTSKGKKGVAAGGKVVFGRRRGGKNGGDGDTDSDTEETSGPPSAGGGTSVRARGRSLRRAGSPSTSVD
ncbi:hypothetical protein INS49_003474 [Diaporthe citri]|uniref:uncharacterized protein n=1 Tax=Diaporthe citri TaxID=83186 RepID=UPI001C81554C|nr:uncharacterized protein INS49_003474 [Diaporthe citri]KAG6355512.1 hypothetical protein INS49_003474 [Diaporthe citri]